QEVLMLELPQHAGLAAVEKEIAVPADDREQHPRADQARVAREMLALALPEPVVAVLRFEARERALGVRQRAARRGTREQTEPDEVGARELGRIVEREVDHDRHAVVLELPIAQRRGLPRVLEAERLQQELPMRGKTG